MVALPAARPRPPAEISAGGEALLSRARFTPERASAVLAAVSAVIASTILAPPALAGARQGTQIRIRYYPRTGSDSSPRDGL